MDDAAELLRLLETYRSDPEDTEGQLVVLADGANIFELPEDAYQGELAEQLQLVAAVARSLTPSAVGLSVFVDADGRLLRDAAPGAVRKIACLGVDGSRRFTSRPLQGETTAEDEQHFSDLFGAATLQALAAMLPNAEEQQAALAEQQERRRQLASLSGVELALLLETAVKTLACRRQQASPAELAEEIASERFPDADSDGWWLSKWQERHDAHPPRKPFDLSDPEWMLARLDGAEIEELIEQAACEQALRIGSVPSRILADFAAEHPAWAEGDVKRLSRLTETAWRGQQMLTVEARIAEHGYTYTYILDSPPFCYTAGLWQTYQHPELLIFGVNQQDAVNLIGALADEIRGGRRYEPGVLTEPFNLPVALLEIGKDEIAAHLKVTTSFYGDLRYRAYQLVLSDRNGLLPWQDGCDEAFARQQPLLGEIPGS